MIGVVAKVASSTNEINIVKLVRIILQYGFQPWIIWSRWNWNPS